ncbi:hypothetical protein GCK72_003177 [Caenorhabditis remanei]|uniref:Uncharacterized protein n=1 Tax=Caenorhabditis remanei TaxID=31234 RepID=A0A6A5HVW6_CAERE|nr:hypothetical protein GCK72_003177 [Caenorhabditis remanei]KAF1771351.1 hypothetical protein GCK72_003177 [Caenorhabditis remanei]
MSQLSLILLLATMGACAHSAVVIAREYTPEPAARTTRPFPKMSDTEEDSTKMQVVVVLLVAFCVSLAITVIIRFLRKYSERQRLYSSFN